MSKPDGGSAFPNYITDMLIHASDSDQQDVLVRNMKGMSLRNYIAIKAMPALMEYYKPGNEELIAEEAYAQADAMIAESEK